MATKKIHFEVTSREGHSEYDLVPKEALAKIQELADENKWLYIGGKPQNTDMITEDELVNAYDEGQEIMMVNGLGGGQTNVELELVVEDKQKEDVVINFTEPYTNIKKVEIKVGKDSLISVLRDRAVIVNALERKLEEKAISEANAMRTLLNV